MKCGYIRDTWDCGETLEVEEKHTGRYGARGQKREPKKEPTPEDIIRQNQWKRVRELRRLVKWNFTTGDSWITLTYQKDNKKKWKKALGGQYGCLYIDEVNTADIDFVREASMRCDYLMATLNPDDPTLDVYKEYINCSRPFRPW